MEEKKNNSPEEIAKKIERIKTLLEAGEKFQISVKCNKCAKTIDIDNDYLIQIHEVKKHENH